MKQNETEGMDNGEENHEKDSKEITDESNQREAEREEHDKIQEGTSSENQVQDGGKNEEEHREETWPRCCWDISHQPRKTHKCIN